MIKALLKRIVSDKTLVGNHGAQSHANKPRKKLRFETHLVEHCNLNCKGCDNFSPLAPEEFADVKIYRQDIARLAAIFKNTAEEITLLGGEPLLHPDINEFICISREYFPVAKIRIMSNGILLGKQQEDFWQVCHNNQVKIEVTPYPINIDFKKIESIAAKYDVDFSCNNGKVEKKLFCLPIDLMGKQNIENNFALCHRANSCISLAHGKLYTCTVAPNIRHFNNFFKTNLQVTENDYIDIYKADNAAEILKFLSQPIPFCKYCDIKNTHGNIKWEVSKKNIQEWGL